LKQSKARLFQDAFIPLIYSNAIAKIEGHVAPGGDVNVIDEAGELIGRGFYNPHSMFRVRLVASRRDDKLMSATLSDLLAYRFRSAAALRLACGLPSPGGTTGYRLVNSEGDLLSGLIVDIFDKTAVIQSSSFWTEKYQGVIIDSFQKAFPDMEIAWRRSINFLRQDGWEVEKSNGEDAQPEPNAEKPVVIMENGLKFSALPGSGQKTGFYFDQRENREFIAKLCSGNYNVFSSIMSVIP
jgi:23S rRNA G2069 N7-methylase RlmK/C1962 C5-methylase RlmI